MTIETPPSNSALAIPAHMLAWEVSSRGEPSEALQLAEIPVPHPLAGEVLIEIWSAGLGFADVMLARGGHHEHPDLPFTPGLEACGEIVAVGDGVERTRLGERVIGSMSLPHGSLAKYAIAKAGHLLPAPTALGDASASVFLIAYQTAWFGLYRRAGVHVGETVLVNAAAGGVGSAAVQLARAAGAKVIGVVGSADKIVVAQRLGAGVVIDRSTQDIVDAVADATGGRGVDVVFDPVGGEVLEAATSLVAFEGRIVLVGQASGKIASASTEDLRQRNYSVLGLNWVSYLDQDPALVRRAHADLTSLVDVGAISPLVTDRVPFEDAPDALARIAAGTTTGRIAVSPP